jgi:hypothetical protein
LMADTQVASDRLRLRREPVSGEVAVFTIPGNHAQLTLG